MSKYVIFSFDDGRKDQYDEAYYILKKYGFRATINVVSDFINESSDFDACRNWGKKSVTWSNLREMSEAGWEIACHGATHKNTVSDIEHWLDDPQISENGWDSDVGFASPGSFLTVANADEIIKLKRQGKLLYVRSGKQSRREGILYIVNTIINKYIHSRKLFYYLNKDCILSKQEDILMSVGVTKYNTVKELMYFIEKLNDNESVIFMFHSINLSSKNKWCWRREQLEQLCYEISKKNNIKVCTTREWWKNV